MENYWIFRRNLEHPMIFLPFDSSVLSSFTLLWDINFGIFKTFLFFFIAISNKLKNSWIYCLIILASWNIDQFAITCNSFLNVFIFNWWFNYYFLCLADGHRQSEGIDERYAWSKKQSHAASRRDFKRI